MTTTNKALALPANASLSWDVPLNNNFAMIDAALGSSQSINVTGFAGGNIVLTSTFPLVSAPPMTGASYIPMRITVAGTMSANVNIQVPVGVDGMWVVSNNTTGAYVLTFGGVGAGTSVTIPTGANLLCWCDGTNAILIGASTPTGGLATVGDLKFTAAPAVPPGWLLCYGQAVSRSTYSALYAVIGTTYGAGDGSTTFNLPDGRGRVLAGADNMGGTAANVMPGAVLGLSQGNYQVTLSVAQMPQHSHTDSGHTHTDGGHYHNMPYNLVAQSPGTGAVGGYGMRAQAVATIVGYASITQGYAVLTSTGSSQPHSNVQPTISVNTLIYAGV
jgi:microcystin-dependent protein